MIQVARRLHEKQLFHADQSILNWFMSNAVLNAKGFLAKEDAVNGSNVGSRKIDCVIALLNAQMVMTESETFFNEAQTNADHEICIWTQPLNARWAREGNPSPWMATYEHEPEEGVIIAMKPEGNTRQLYA